MANHVMCNDDNNNNKNFPFLKKQIPCIQFMKPTLQTYWKPQLFHLNRETLSPKIFLQRNTYVEYSVPKIDMKSPQGNANLEAS